MKKRSAKKETDTEYLARLMADGFAEVNKRFDGVDERFDGIDHRLDGIDVRLDEMSSDITALQKGQTETHRRLDSIDRKQMGMIHSLDETVHRREFVSPVHRVGALEK